MANPKKLTRAQVHKQIDAFRGIGREAEQKPSPEQWAAFQRARDGKAINHGWTRIRVD